MRIPNFTADEARGADYQDFIYDWFEENHGVRPVHYEGKEAQKQGENSWGLEIKLDDQWRIYGNLYIETADRYDGSGGIYRNNNTSNFLIGDKTAFWIFPIETLQKLHRQTIIYTREELQWWRTLGCRAPVEYVYHRTKNPQSQSKCFLLPVKEARKFCVMHRDLRKNQ